MLSFNTNESVPFPSNIPVIYPVQTIILGTYYKYIPCLNYNIN